MTGNAENRRWCRCNQMFALLVLLGAAYQAMRTEFPQRWHNQI